MQIRGAVPQQGAQGSGADLGGPGKWFSPEEVSRGRIGQAGRSWT